MPSPRDRLLSDVMPFLVEIGAGRCSITDAMIAAEPDESVREVLVALLVLHEDLTYQQKQRERADAERERLLTELQLAVEARDEFLAIASHELRTPLSTLVLQLGALTRTADDRSDARLASAQRQVQRLVALVGRLLDVSRLTTRSRPYAPERVDASDIVRGIVEQAQKAAPANTEIRFETPSSAYVEVDPLRLEQAVGNVVDNAIRYGQGRPVTVTIRDEDAVCIEVRDEGMGIAPDEVPTIFERYGRAESSRHFGGMGLGLWVVRESVREMGGSVDVTSEPGRGSLFRLTIPAASRA